VPHTYPVHIIIKIILTRDDDSARLGDYHRLLHIAETIENLILNRRQPGGGGGLYMRIKYTEAYVKRFWLPIS